MWGAAKEITEKVNIMENENNLNELNEYTEYTAAGSERTEEAAQPENTVGGGNDLSGGAADNTMRSYKFDCFRFGLFLTATLLLRELATGLSPLFVSLIGFLNITSTDALYAVSLLYSALFCQILPSILAAVMLKYSFKNLCGGFKPPKQSKKAFANFPLMYGAGMTVNLITMAVMSLILKKGDIGDSINGTGLQPPTLASSFILFILTVIIAPVFEEFIFRGAVMNLLKPYGGGIAIFVSAFCFGIFHGNFQQFFFAFVLGIVLGYIGYATGSVFCTTLLHLMFNGISGIIMIFISTDAVKKRSLDRYAELSDGESLVMTFYALFMIIVILTALVGFIAMINKLRKIKRYRIPKVWGEVGNGKKTAIMLLTLPVILAMLLMVDIMGFGFIGEKLSEAVSSMMGLTV